MAARKKTRRAKAAAILKATSARAQGAGTTCRTCANPKWRAAIQDILRNMVSGESDPFTPVSHIFTAISTEFKALEIPRYTLKRTALVNHVKSCEELLWNDVKRKQIQDSEESPQSGG